MKIRVVAVGRLKEDFFRAAESEYLRRLRPLCQVAIEEVRDDAALARAVPEARGSSGALVVALDQRGDLVSSEDLAAMLGEEEQRGGGRPVVFAIGGPDGHPEALRRRADRLIAFGRITIAHRLVRVVLLEQIYRAFTILRGHPYHR